jgi:chromosome partitioning protein
MSQIITVANQKGGVGKTTTVINLASGLAIVGKRTLIIDLDPQGNASTGLGIDYVDRKNTSYDCLIQNLDINQAIYKTLVPQLDIVPSNMDLAAAEIELTSLSNKEHILKNILSKISDQYDYIIMDSPPSLGLLTLNALVACHEVLIPMQCEFFSLEGLSHLLKTIELVKRKLNTKLKIKGILLTMHDRRNGLTAVVEQDVRNHLSNLVFNSVIPRNVKLSEAPSYGKPGVIYDFKSIGAMAYISFVKEFLNKT